MADFAAARLNMVESQGRPADVTDVRINDAMRVLPRESFLPPERAYLAAELDGSLVAISLRCPGPNPLQKRSNICSFCLTGHTGGVTLMVAPRVGKAGQQGNSVGTYLCTDLACSLYMRGKKPVMGLGGRFKERLTLEEQVERTMTNLAAFMAKVTA